MSDLVNMEEIINKTAEYAWEAIEEFVKNGIQKEHPEVIFNAQYKDKVKQTFKSKYEYVQQNYMKDHDKPLDRHKQAALLICTVIEEDVLNSTSIPEGELFVAKYSLALSLGLSFLKTKLEDVLEEKKLGKLTVDFTDIKAFTCKTDYFDVLYRNFIFEERKNNEIFALTLANTLFLLEYIAIMKSGISPEKLKEY